MLNLGNVFILGDSYSTYENFIPSGYAFYYSNNVFKDTDVNDVEQTWWKLLLNETKSKLVQNNSWSGTTICNTGYDGVYAVHSFINRFDELAGNGFFENNKIDTFFIFGATNDNWADAPIGSLKYSDYTEEELKCVLPAVCYLFNKVKNTLPHAKIVSIINTELKPEITNGIMKAAEQIGIEAIVLKEFEKNAGHPTIAGMKNIKNQIQDYLSKIY